MLLPFATPLLQSPAAAAMAALLAEQVSALLRQAVAVRPAGLVPEAAAAARHSLQGPAAYLVAVAHSARRWPAEAGRCPKTAATARAALKAVQAARSC